ncbi:MAG: type II secretion system protein GspE, partial [Rhodanobacteraceae bacterium]|nr:type II secretion system protein GspE [Rhodanobacteraceae bacterium]
MTSMPRLPFGFARKHGVAVLGLGNGKARIACRPDVKPEALLELRRFLGTPLAPEKVPAERFEALLQELYEGGGEDSRSMAADIDQKLDLKQLADELPEPTDLMESEDDAPIIRLINALLAEAVRENASDIHIEPYENRLVVR